MALYLLLIGVALSFFIMKNINKISTKKAKTIILAGPFILGGAIYLGISLFTKNASPESCDGEALMGILLSFLLFGMGLILNFVNMFQLVLDKLVKK